MFNYVHLQHMYYGEKVCLRALEMEDLDIILEHFNNLEIRQYLNTQIPMSRNAERQWLERSTTMDPWKDGGMTLAIEDKKTSEFLGTVSLFDISKQHKRAEFGIAIHQPKNFGKGYGTDAVKTFMKFIFNELAMKRICIHTLDWNIRALKCFEKCGFTQCGRIKRNEKEFIEMEVTI